MNRKRIVFLILIGLFILGCKKPQKVKETEKESPIKVGVLDYGYYNDRSFVDKIVSSLKNNFNIDAKKLTIDETQHFNLEDSELIFGIGTVMNDFFPAICDKYPEKNFVLIDSVLKEKRENLKEIAIKREDAAFLAGVIASKISDNRKVLFVGGEKIPLVESVEYGFKSGVNYLETESPIDFNVDYLSSFHDVDAMSELLNSFKNGGADVVFSVSGDADIKDDDASYKLIKFDDYLANGSLRPDISITVDYGRVIKKFMESGEPNFSEYSLEDDVVFVDVKNYLDEEGLKTVDEIKNDIISGKILVPYDSESYKLYINKNLK
ncbi:MAG: BMP family lipoprotein [Ezakiella coagulans]|uniref:BMP family lipoprotein n=1 Tax=Ezakiella coagulans TaxID=46507 RepID=UPI003999973B